MGQKEQNVEGTIAGLNSVITIQIEIKNDSSTSQTVEFNLRGGYIQNILNSNIVKGAPGILMTRSSSSYNGEFWSQAANIKTVVFETEMNPKEDATYTYDVSEKKNKSVISYLVTDTEDTSKYTLYIQSNEKVYANPNSSNLFYKFTNLETIEGLEYLNTSNVTNMGSMFNQCSKLTTLDVSNFDTSNVTTMKAMFYNCNKLTTLDVHNFNTSKITDMSNMFYECSNLTTLDLSNFDTSNVTLMNSMFNGCSGLTGLDLSNFDTSNVIRMGGMFRDCNSLTTLDVSKFDTSNVTDMGLMFYWCNNLTTLDLSNFNTSNVTDMEWTFAQCNNLTTLDVSNFNTSNVTNMAGMFSDCNSLTLLDVSNFDTSNVTIFGNSSYYGMFQNCNNLTSLDVSSFNTSKCTNMSKMFENCSNITLLDLSNFDTSNVPHMYNMFRGCNKLTTTITIKGTKATSYRYMFFNAATASGAQITVNYTADASELVDQMIATKSSTSNIVKASSPEPEYTITLNSDADITLSSTTGYRFKEIILNPNQDNYAITSFKMNGQTIKGNSFKMPAENVTITDVILSEITIVESEHNPYPNSLNNQEYLNKTWDGATSLTVILEYQTESTNYDWIYLYDKDNKAYGKYGGTTKTETITIPGDTLRIVFRTDGSGNSYYGFKATIIPNY